jgi:hypothetical protein
MTEQLRRVMGLLQLGQLGLHFITGLHHYQILEQRAYFVLLYYSASAMRSDGELLNKFCDFPHA